MPKLQRNKKKLIITLISIMVFMLLCLTLCFTIIKFNNKSNAIHSLSEENKEKLMTLSGDLDKLDQNIITNQGYLSEVTQIQSVTTDDLSQLSTELENVEKQLVDIAVTIERQDANESVKALTNQHQALMEQIVLSKNLINDLISKAENQHLLNSEKLTSLSTSFSEISNQLNSYYAALTTLIQDIQYSTDSSNTELFILLQDSHSNLQKLLSNYSVALDNTLQQRFLHLSGNLEKIRNQISESKDIINNNLLINQSETLSAFDKLQNNINMATSDIRAAHTEVQVLIAELSKKSANSHAEILSSLYAMDTDFKKIAQENLTNITTALQDIQTNVDSSMTSLQSKISSTLQNMNLDFENILAQYNSDTTNQFNSLQTSMNSHFTTISKHLNTSDDTLREYLNNIMLGIDQKLNQVFTYVSSGKAKLASALLTKGVACKQDASFEEINQAILSISQKVVIGTDQLPGSVTYEYHYHKDSNGKTPHTEQHTSNGGCYTSPVTHIHTGDAVGGGGCYTIPVTHTHTDNCYTITKSERKITGYWFTGTGTGHACCDNSHAQNWARFRYEDNIYKNKELVSSTIGEGELGYCCQLCINKAASDKGYVYTNTDITCGFSEGLNRYDLGCGKTITTIIAYKPSCGLSDGQITGAHITYQKENTEVLID